MFCLEAREGVVSTERSRTHCLSAAALSVKNSWEREFEGCPKVLEVRCYQPQCHQIFQTRSLAVVQDRRERTGRGFDLHEVCSMMLPGVCKRLPEPASFVAGRGIITCARPKNSLKISHTPYPPPRKRSCARRLQRCRPWLHAPAAP